MMCIELADVFTVIGMATVAIGIGVGWYWLGHRIERHL
jgi:hypothetical protein